MKVDWSKWSAVAEILSAIAIVATLLYLAIQTQQTNRALQASSRESTMLADVAILTAFVNNPEMNLNLDVVDLTAIESAQVGNALAALMRIREFAWFQYQADVMDLSTWESYAAPVARILSTAQGAEWWLRIRGEYDPEFAADIDRRIEEYSPQ